MKVLMTGATGFVGSTMAQKALTEKNLELRVLVRDPKSGSARRLADMGAELAKGDILDPTSLDRALGDGSIDAIIHLVGIIAEKGDATFKRVHYLGSKNVVEAALRAGVERYLHMSALGTAPGEDKSEYHKTKWAAEEIVRASGLDWTIFRPSIVTGKDDLFVNRFALFADQWVIVAGGWLPAPMPFIPLPGGGKSKFQPVTVNDVAEAFLRALERPATIGKVYDVVGPDVVTLKQIVQTVKEIRGSWKPAVGLPMWIVRLQAPVLQHLPYPLDLNPVQVRMMKDDNTGNVEPMKRDLGMEPTSFREGVASYLAPRDDEEEEARHDDRAEAAESHGHHKSHAEEAVDEEPETPSVGEQADEDKAEAEEQKEAAEASSNKER